MTQTDPPRTLATVEARLLAEGANPNNFAIGCNGRGDDIHRLIRANGRFEIAYMERGLAHAPEFTSEDEAAACAYFYHLISNQQHWHCCCVFSAPEPEAELAARLEAAGLQLRRDSIPYTAETRYYRCFVLGRDVFMARALLGALPIRDKGVA